MDCSQTDVVHALYKRMGQALIVRARRIVRRDDVAQEIVQETFVKLWDLAPRFVAEEAAFAWLYKTSHNLAIDHLRARFTRSVSLEDDGVGELAGRGAAADAAAETGQLVGRFLGKLTREEASVYIYKVVDRMTLDEIADFIGTSSKTVSRMLIKIDSKLARVMVGMHAELAL